MIRKYLRAIRRQWWIARNRETIRRRLNLPS